MTDIILVYEAAQDPLTLKFKFTHLISTVYNGNRFNFDHIINAQMCCKPIEYVCKKNDYLNKPTIVLEKKIFKTLIK